MAENNNKEHFKLIYVKSRYYRRTFCFAFVVLNILVISLLIIVKHQTLDYYTMLDILNHLFPSIIIIGGLGWFTGLILDNPKRHMIIDYKDVIYEELLKQNVKITPEELDRKLRIIKDEDLIEEEENFPFEDGNMKIGESEIDL